MREESEWGIYHVTVRGVGRQLIFLSSADRMFFLKKMSEFKKETDVKILAYCLMDNHVHLLLDSEMVQISLFMQKLEESYIRFFNWKYDRVGTLFQGRFGSKPIVSERNLLCAIRYIHSNPQKAGMCRAKDYTWSSYDEYCNSDCICDLHQMKEIIGGSSGFAELMAADDSEDEEIAIEEYHQLTDSEALAIADKIYSHKNVSEIKALPASARKVLVCKMFQAGVSVRQIETIAGIGRGAIQYTVRGLKRKKRYI